MSQVYKGTGRMLARQPLSTDIGFGLAEVLSDVGHELELRTIGFAAQHIDDGEFFESIHSQFDRRSPSGKDVLVYSNDPLAVSKEFGHVERVEIRHEGRLIGYKIVPVRGIHAFSRAMNSLPTVEQMTDYGDPEALVMEILRAVIVAPVEVQETPFPDLGVVVADGGVTAHLVSRAASDGPWGYVERCVFAVDVWKTGRTAALQLAGLCRTTLKASVGKPYPAGSLTSYVENSAPTEFPSGIKLTGVTQVNALYELHICPP